MTTGDRGKLFIPFVPLFTLFLLSKIVWLVRSTQDRAVLVRALAGDMVLCFLAIHFTLTMPLSTQVYKWVPVKLTLRVAIASHQDGVETLLVASCYGK